MPAKKVQDDNKVMDVSRPGKGKVVAATSRPVITPVAKKTPVAEAKAEEAAASLVPEAEQPEALAPSATHKVIQPLSDVDKGAEEVKISVISTVPAAQDEEKPAESAENEKKADSEAEANPVVEETKPEPATEPVPESSAEPAEEAAKPAEDTATGQDEETSSDDEASPEASDEAGVNALAESVSSKKEAAKKAEAQAQKDAAIQELIDNKQYIVAIGHEGPNTPKGARRHHSNLLMIPVLLLLAALIAGYLLLDAGVIKANIALPYEFIKESQDAAEGSINLSPTDDSEEAAAEEKETDATEQAETSATAAANDRDRKNELKNLQQKLETYFNDNDTYPAALSDLNPALTADETTGPTGDAYVYTPSTDGESYVLSASLENKNDKDAVDGVYSLQSVNQ